MKSLLLIFILFLIFAGCSSGKPENTNTEEKDYRAWIDSKCGRCHDASEYSHLLEITRNMSGDKFEQLLLGMVHGDIRLSESEINEALEYLKNEGLLM